MTSVSQHAKVSTTPDTDALHSNTRTVNSHQSQDDITRLSDLITDYEHVQLKPSEYTDHQTQDIDQDIDPDNNFFFNLNENCHYYTSEQFNAKIDCTGKLTIIHFNSRHLSKNFHAIKDYLHTFAIPFHVIAISESWITEGEETNYTLEGYDLVNINRQNKGGGGVGIFVINDLQFHIVDEMTVTMDNVLECITIEICMEKTKNIIISCIYRTPGTSIEIFTNWIDSMFSKFCNKVVVFCGDFNIDLLNPSNYSAIDTFINTMYSVSLFPKITRPSRITSYSATLIDNIFTNDIENKSESGLLIKDITDHLPVFVDMALVKLVIPAIVKPLTHIFNLDSGKTLQLQVRIFFRKASTTF